MPRARASVLRAAFVIVSIAIVSVSEAAVRTPGDLDADGRATVRDAHRLVRHVLHEQDLPDADLPYADADQDGFVGDLDIDDEVFIVLGRPYAPTTMSSSPDRGESDVAVTRETALHFRRPLGDGVDPEGAISVQFAGQPIMRHLHLSADRQTLTIFYDQDLPEAARVRVDVLGDALDDGLGGHPDVEGNGLPGGNVAIEFDTVSLTGLANTSISGSIFASSLGDGGVSEPLKNVTITVDGNPALNTVTGRMGEFSLRPCPVGYFFVHVNGGTTSNAHPDGTYYPFVGKEWHSVAGADTPMDNIYLPLVPEGTLQAVSDLPGDDTDITFAPQVLADHPELAGVQITVPGGALYADDGTVGGMVGIAPVSPDRLPGKLPPGLNFPIVISVQTDGATNFDMPVPACFPNLPDPGTSETLPPLGKTALWSFNHDTGKFEIVGPATVTGDGKLACTDPGVGIPAPGWHGVSPSSPTGPRSPPRPPPPPPPYDPPPPRPEEPGCRGLNGQEIGDTAGDLLTTVAQCLAEFSDVSARFKQILSIVGTIRTMFGDVIALVDTLNDPMTNRAATARDVFKVVNDAKGIALMLTQEVKENSPFQKGRAILNCLASVLGSLDNLCGRVQGACSSTGLRITCFAVTTVKNAVAAFNAYLSAAEDGFRRFAMTAACALMDQIAAKLNFEAGQPPDSNGVSQAALSDDDPVPPDVIDDLHALGLELGAIDADMAPAEQAALAVPMIEEGHEMAMEGYAQWLLEPPDYPTDAWWRLVVRNAPQRGRSNGSGQFVVNLPPNAPYVIDVYDPADESLGEATGTTSSPGYATGLNALQPVPIPPADQDADGLPDLIEGVVGTRADLADTDGDASTDAEEVRAGTNPLDGVAVEVGVAAIANTPGNALDVAVTSELVAVADFTGGVSVFNAFLGQTPTLVAVVPTPQPAIRVAIAGQRLLATLTDGRVQVEDLTDPTKPKVERMLDLDSDIHVAIASGNVAFLGLEDGSVASVDLRTGLTIDRLALPYNGSTLTVGDLAIEGLTLYAVQSHQLATMPLRAGELMVEGSCPLSASFSFAHPLRLFVGGGIGLATGITGYVTVDLSDPQNPHEIQGRNSGQVDWKQIVANGVGPGSVGLATLATSGGSDDQDVFLYDTSDPTDNTAFIDRIITPGRAQSAVICNGLGYVADGESGLTVVRYLAPDTMHVPPTVDLGVLPGSFAQGFQSGQRIVLRADAHDDVQVRDVEFFIDGVRVAKDGSFPFEAIFTVPVGTVSKTSATFQARAVDTAGTATSSAIVTAALAADATAPVVQSRRPAPDAVVGTMNVAISAGFSETMDPSTLFAGITVRSQGPDASLDTADDVTLAATLTWDEGSQLAILTPSGALEPGRYRISVSAPAADPAGNIVTPATWTFTANPGLDTDGDTLPDDYETSKTMTSRTDSDSDHDFLPDGAEDPDADTLMNRDELLDGTDPLDADTDDDGVDDGTEVARHCRPTIPDVTKVRGAVELNGNPVDGAMVTIVGRPGFMGTTAVGRYEIAGVPACIDSFDVQADVTQGGKIYRGVVAGVAPTGDLTVAAVMALARRDDDNDGVPNDAEASLGYLANDSDSDNDNVLDGDEDFDGDGLANRVEFEIGTDPKLVDTDGDGASDREEFRAGCNPLGPDTTTIIGRVVRLGSPVPGVSVRVAGHADVTSVGNGTFSFPSSRQCGDVVARAVTQIGSQRLAGASAAKPVSVGGTTDVGDVTLLPIPPVDPFPYRRFVLSADSSTTGTMRTADVNGDGKIDAIVAVDGPFFPVAGPDRIDVLLNDGQGGFLPGVGNTFGVADNEHRGPLGLNVVDVNGDGRRDILALKDGGRQVGVLLASGAPGSFSPAAFYDLPSGFFSNIAFNSLAVADFDGDGKPDAAAGRSAPELTILKGAGDGTFGGTAGFTTPFMPSEDMIAADQTGDGEPDLIALGSDMSGHASVAVFPKLPGGGLGDPFRQQLASLLNDKVAVAQVDGDGVPDLVVTNRSYFDGGTPRDPSVSVFLGLPFGGMDPEIVTSLPSNPSGRPAVADFSGDGKADFALGGSFATLEPTTVLLGTGDGNGSSAHSIDSPPAMFDLTARDMDGDGLRDLVGLLTSSGVAIASGRGDGRFDTFSKVVTGFSSAPNEVRLADLDGDGKLDAVSLDQSNKTLQVLRGLGDGTFGVPANTIVELFPRGLLLTDVNADGRRDVVYVAPTTAKLVVRLGVGNATFGSATLVSISANPFAVAAGDVNGDGRVDLVTVHRDGTAVVCLQQLNGTFTPQAPIAAGSEPTTVAIGDFTGDGKVDLVTGSQHDQSNPAHDVNVLAGVGNGTFGAPTFLSGSPASSTLALADVDEDGKLDIVALAGETGRVYYGDGGPSLALTAYEKFSSIGGESLVADVDADSHLDIVSANNGGVSVTLRKGDGAGGFAAPRSFVVGEGVRGLALGDVNGDAKPDLVTACPGKSMITVVLHR